MQGGKTMNQSNKFLQALEQLNLTPEELQLIAKAIEDYALEYQSNEVQSTINIRSILTQQLAIKPNLKGFYYIEDALEFAMEDREYLNGITTILYPMIAQKNATTSSRVERSIRHAIETSWDNVTEENREIIFYTKIDENPTNKAYLAYVLNYIDSLEINTEPDFEETFTKTRTKKMK